MPRVLQISPRLPYPLDDGGRIATWNLSRCLRHNGYDIDFVCYSSNAVPRSEWERASHDVLASTSMAYKNMERQYPVDLIRAMLTGSSYFTRKFLTKACTKLIQRLLTKHEYDVTIIESAYMGVFLPVVRAAGQRAGRVLLRQQNVERDILERLSEREPNWAYQYMLSRETTLFGDFEATLIDSVDEVLAITSADAKTMASRGAQTPIRTLNPFIDVERYRLDEHVQVKPHTIVHVGNMAWMPNKNGVDWFLQHVWPSVRKQYPGAEFHIVGKHPPAHLKNGDGIFVVGYVGDERPIIRSANVFIVPLLEGSGVRMKILTAMAMGKVSLSTTLGASGIDFDGLIIRDRAGAWIEAIAEQFRQPAKLSMAAAQYIARHYSWRQPLEL